jgi:hypothetical protein
MVRRSITPQPDPKEDTPEVPDQIPQILTLEGFEGSEKIEAIPGIKDLITLVQLSTQAELKELLKALGPESPEAKIITSMRTQVAHLDRRFPEAAQLQILGAYMVAMPNPLSVTPETVIANINQKCKEAASSLRLTPKTEKPNSKFTIKTKDIKHHNTIPDETREMHETATQALKSMDPFSLKYRVLAALTHQYWGVATQSLRDRFQLDSNKLAPAITTLRNTDLKKIDLTITIRNGVAYLEKLTSKKPTTVTVINPEEETYQTYIDKVTEIDTETIEAAKRQAAIKSPLNRQLTTQRKKVQFEDFSQATETELEAASRILPQDSDENSAVNRAILQTLIDNNTLTTEMIEARIGVIMFSQNRTYKEGTYLKGNRQRTLNTQIAASGVSLLKSGKAWRIGLRRAKMVKAKEDKAVIEKLKAMHEEVIKAEVRSGHNKAVQCLIHEYWGVRLPLIAKKANISERFVALELEKFNKEVLASTPYEIVIRNGIAIIAEKNNPIRIPSATEQKKPAPPKPTPPPPTPKPAKTVLPPPLPRRYRTLITFDDEAPEATTALAVEPASVVETTPQPPVETPRSNLREMTKGELRKMASKLTTQVRALQTELETLQYRHKVDIARLKIALGQKDKSKGKERLNQRLRLEEERKKLSLATKRLAQLTTEILDLRTQLAAAEARPTLVINTPGQKAPTETIETLKTPENPEERSQHIALLLKATEEEIEMLIEALDLKPKDAKYKALKGTRKLGKLKETSTIQSLNTKLVARGFRTERHDSKDRTTNLDINSTNNLTEKTEQIHKTAQRLAIESEHTILFLLAEEYWGVEFKALQNLTQMTPETLRAEINRINEAIAQHNIRIWERNGILIIGDINQMLEIPLPPMPGTLHQYTNFLRKEAAKLEEQQNEKSYYSIEGEVLKILLSPPHTFEISLLADMMPIEGLKGLENSGEKGVAEQKIINAALRLRARISSTGANLVIKTSQNRLSLEIPQSSTTTATEKSPKDRIQTIIDSLGQGRKKQILSIMQKHPEGPTIQYIENLTLAPENVVHTSITRLNTTLLKPIGIRIISIDNRLFFQAQNWEFIEPESKQASTSPIDEHQETEAYEDANYADLVPQNTHPEDDLFAEYPYETNDEDLELDAHDSPEDGLFPEGFTQTTTMLEAANLKIEDLEAQIRTLEADLRESLLA